MVCNRDRRLLRPEREAVAPAVNGEIKERSKPGRLFAITILNKGAPQAKVSVAIACLKARRRNAQEPSGRARKWPFFAPNGGSRKGGQHA
jgi:hypothetical protein